MIERAVIPKYDIKGVDKKSCFDTDLFVHADTEENVRMKAEMKGIVVTSVNIDDLEAAIDRLDGDVEAALLCHGNMASAHDWRLVLVPVIDRYRALDIAQLFRADAAFSIPELYESLEAEGCRYAICLPANDVRYR